jgi:uncharacterized RDD family membrane protein YckC
VSGATVAFAYAGRQYLLGYGDDFFGIWERPGRGEPDRAFPRSDEGWAQAWLAFRAMEPHAARITPALPFGIHAADVQEDATLATGESSAVLATAGSRLLARTLDVLLVAAAVLSLLAVAGTYPNDPSAILPGIVWLVFLSAAYEVTLVGTRGQTIGKMVLHIRIAALPDGGVPGFGRAALRWAVPVVMNVVPFAGLLAYVPIMFDPVRQGVHDKMAGTVVVSTRGVRRAPGSVISTSQDAEADRSDVTRRPPEEEAFVFGEEDAPGRRLERTVGAYEPFEPPSHSRLPPGAIWAGRAWCGSLAAG